MKTRVEWPGRSVAPAAWLVLVAVALVGCDRRAVEKDAALAASSVSANESAAVPPAGVVDSIFPMAVMLGRFRAGLPEPKQMMHGLPTRDALVEHILQALAANDTTALAEVAVDQAEYAWLYFPSADIARPPYELPPALAWFRVQEGSRKGVFRAMRDLGGHKLEMQGYTCAEPRTEGTNKIWANCAVTFSRDGAAPVTLELFESILERDGKFAILSFANSF